jgi:hypothetical protein
VDDPLPIFIVQDSLSVTVLCVLNVMKDYFIENKTASFMSLFQLFYIFHNSWKQIGILHRIFSHSPHTMFVIPTFGIEEESDKLFVV